MKLNFMQRLAFAFGFKQATQRTYLGYMDTGYGVSSPRDYRGFSDEGYKQNVIAYRCINLVSNSVAMLPWVLFEKQRGGEREEVMQSPLLDLLERPNPMQARAAFLQSITNYFLISGNSFVEAVAADAGKVKELWPLRPDYMKIKPGQFGIPQAYTYCVGGYEKNFPVDIMGRSAILHLKTFNPLDSWWGLSPIESAASGVDQHNAMGVWNYSLLKNSARPSGALIYSAETTLTEEQRRQIKEDMSEQWQNPTNAGRPFMLEGGMDWKEMSFSPKDMDFIISKKVTAVDIANAFGVPPQLIGVDGSQTFANFEQAMEFFYVYTVLPVADLIRDELNRWLTPTFSKTQQLDYDKDKIEALSAKREKLFERARNSTWLTENEKREMTGFEKYDSSVTDPADMLFINAGLIPLSLAADPSLGTGDVEETEDTIGDFQKPPANEDENESDESELEEELESEDTDKQAFLNYFEGKSFNVRSRAGKQRMWALQFRRRMEYEKTFYHQLRAHFKDEGKTMVKSLAGVPVALFEFVINSVLESTEKRLENIMESNIKRTMKAFGKDVLDIRKNVHVVLEKKDPTDDFFNSWVNLYLENELGKKIKNIERTTRTQLLKELRKQAVESQTAGESLDQFAKRIESVTINKYQVFSEPRAQMIARTETHNASQQASLKAAEALEVPGLEKEWVWADRETARQNHREMLGVSIPVEDSFEVPKAKGNGVDLMLGPGAEDAPADQVINCKCILVFNPPADFATGTGEEDEG